MSFMKTTIIIAILLFRIHARQDNVIVTSERKYFANYTENALTLKVLSHIHNFTVSTIRSPNIYKRRMFQSFCLFYQLAIVENPCNFFAGSSSDNVTDTFGQCELIAYIGNRQFFNALYEEDRRLSKS